MPVKYCKGLQEKKVKLATGVELEDGEVKADDVAIVRVEELSPFPAKDIGDVLEKFSNVKDVIWSQEEPRNMGAWSFVSPRFENLFGVKVRLLSFVLIVLALDVEGDCGYIFFWGKKFARRAGH